MVAALGMSAGCSGAGEESPKTWPAAPVAALAGGTATMEARLNGYALEYALTVTEDPDEALVAVQGDRKLAFRFVDSRGQPVISSGVPSWGVQADRGANGGVVRLSIKGVEPCEAPAFRRIAGWELVAAPR